jgi:hypothetical protein
VNAHNERYAPSRETFLQVCGASLFQKGFNELFSLEKKPHQTLLGKGFVQLSGATA